MADKNNNPAVHLEGFGELLAALSDSIQYAKHLGKKTGVIYVKLKTPPTDDELRHLINQDNPNTTYFKIKTNEYCLLLQKFDKPDQVATIAKRVSTVLPDMKIGIALFPNASDRAEELVNKAREACILSSKQDFNFYKKDVDSKVKQKLRLEKDIHKALVNEELVLHYQPIIDFNASKIVSVEALLRWEHPEFGLLNPLDFIPIVEEQDLMIDFGEWIFETAFNDYLEWGLKDKLTISINVAPTQILSYYFVKRMAHRIDQNSLDWSNVQIELTENDYIHDMEESSKKLSELAAKGLKLTLDDYGTGFSSMRYLINLPINNIKIDKCYINSIDSDDNSETLVKSTIEMAHNLGLTVTAEGIETQAQAEILMNLNCDFGQGYLFSKPLSHEELKALVNKSLDVKKIKSSDKS